jgi:heme/copper-type cytochrome/quinol oxidase subunit 3
VSTAISDHGHVVEHGHGDGHGDGHGEGLAHAAPPSLGVDVVKLLMWTFMSSECFLFGSLIITFLVYLNRHQQLAAEGLVDLWKGPLPFEVYDIPYTSVSAFVLLLSSLTMVLALAAAQSNQQRQLRIWLVATALLGMVFLGGQFFEFTTFKTHEGIWFDTNQFGSSFFMLTGFHGAHVTVGVAWLLSLWMYSLRRGISPAKAPRLVEIAGLYWHFVDIVWVVIFTVVYLTPTALRI